MSHIIMDHPVSGCFGTRIGFDFLRVRSFLPRYFFFLAMTIGIMSMLCLAKMNIWVAITVSQFFLSE